MKKLFFISFLILFSYLGFSQHNIIELANNTSVDLEITFVGSQNGCMQEIGATYYIPAGMTTTLKAPFMNFNAPGFDQNNPNPVLWHTIRAFDTCNNTNPGYINFNGICLTGQPIQTIPMVNQSCPGNQVIGEFFQFPGSALHIVYHQ